MNIIISIIILLTMILLHELGHFIAGKLCGAKIYEFSIGMGPLIYSRQGKKETKYSIRLLPLGGYCAFDKDDITGTADMQLNKMSPIKRIIICIAGPLMNILTAIILLLIITFSIGILTNTTTINTVNKNSPIYNILKENDIITKMNDIDIENNYSKWEEIINKNKNHPLKIEYRRNNRIYSTTINPIENNGKYYIGVQLKQMPQKYDIKTNFKYIYLASKNCIKLTIDGISSLLTGKVSINDTSGVVGVVSTMSTYVNTDQLYQLMYLIILISINLGLANLIPIPGLDGSKILIAFIELILRKKLPEKIEERITYIGFLFLIVLMIYVTFNDIIKLI